MDAPPKRRRRSFGFWAAIVLVVGGVLYPLSFGPACWLTAKRYRDVDDRTASRIMILYWPIGHAVYHNRIPRFLKQPICRFAWFGVDRDSYLLLFRNTSQQFVPPVMGTRQPPTAPLPDNPSAP